jgi:5'(3')-deoxyribonucleotidase
MENKKKIVYIDMDRVLVDFDSGVQKTEPEILSLYDEEQYDNIPHVFSRMDPISGAIEAFKALQEKYEVFVLTTAPWRNNTALQDKKDWLEKYLGDLVRKRVIFSHHKDLLLGDYLIDDKEVPGFQGRQFLFGSDQYPDWDSILKELL